MTDSHPSLPFMQPNFQSNFNQRGAIEKNHSCATSTKKKPKNAA
jgi:hypothetical protein